MQHQEQTFGEVPPAEVPPAEAPTTPRTRRWGLPIARPRRVWLGGGAPTAEATDGAEAAR